MNFLQIQRLAKTYGCHVKASQGKLTITNAGYSTSRDLTQQQANDFSARQFQAVCEEVSGRRIVTHWTGGDVA